MSEDQVTEIWKSVEGFPGYEVSTHGHIRSRRSRNGPRNRGFVVDERNAWHMLTVSRVPNGYPRVFLCKDCKTHTKYVHRLVLEAFVGPCPEGLEACHSDDDKLNNKLGNLRWDTRQANVKDRTRNGRTLRGSEIGNSKLTTEDVIAIRRIYRRGMGQKEIAQLFEISRSYVSQVCGSHRWRHVPQ